MPVNLQLNTNGSPVRCDAPSSPLDSGIGDIRGGYGVKTGAECHRWTSFSFKSGIECPVWLRAAIVFSLFQAYLKRVIFWRNMREGMNLKILLNSGRFLSFYIYFYYYYFYFLLYHGSNIFSENIFDLCDLSVLILCPSCVFFYINKALNTKIDDLYCTSSTSLTMAHIINRFCIILVFYYFTVS